MWIFEVQAVNQNLQLAKSGRVLIKIFIVSGLATFIIIGISLNEPWVKIKLSPKGNLVKLDQGLNNTTNAVTNVISTLHAFTSFCPHHQYVKERKELNISLIKKLPEAYIKEDLQRLFQEHLDHYKSVEPRVIHQGKVLSEYKDNHTECEVLECALFTNLIQMSWHCANNSVGATGCEVFNKVARFAKEINTLQKVLIR